MSGLTVEVAAPGAQALLKPRYDEESDILVIEGPGIMAWPYGVTVDGTVVFDLDANRALEKFDVLAPRRSWPRDLECEFSLPDRRGSLVFTRETVATQSFPLPVDVRSDASTEVVKIEIGDRASDDQVALSDSCVALLAGQQLTGFLVSLALP